MAHSEQDASCDVCQSCAASLRCDACRLDLCVACSRVRHRSSLHLTTGRFHFYRPPPADAAEDDGYESPSTASAPNSPAAADQLRRPASVDALWSFDGALAQSLRALTFATDQEPATEAADAVKSPADKRQRSFSDYAATVGDAERWRAQGERSDLWDAMRTDFASRHVVVRCGAGAWDAADVRRVVDRLNNFGSVASTRRELTGSGLLFCTFCDLTSAVAAVDRWRADADIIGFCLPYELPDDVNSATLLVRFAAGAAPISAAELRQVCTCFGQVASVLQPDAQTAKYIVEYSDSRALPAALNGLPHAFHASGPLSVARTTPPTLDVAKLKLFQECLARAVATHPRITRTRPKSFSSSSTSLLTSPTSSVASSINASFLEGAGNNSPMAATSATYPGPGELTSPVLMPQEEQQIWSRPPARSRSNSSSAYLGGSLSSNSFGDSAAYSNGFTLSSSRNIGTLSSRANGYSSFQSAPQLQPSNNQISPPATEQQQQAYFDFRGRQRMQTKFPPMRGSYSTNDHFFRTSAVSSSGHAGVHGGASGGRPSTGRNDQGTGEFSLLIEKVASGEDKRTTLMIRNIPNKYTQQMLLAEINRNHRGNYDFFYLPIDFKNKCNMGYAFINFIEATLIEAFHNEFDGQKWTNFNSEKVCAISYARLQGKQAMIARFQNSSLLEKHESYRPLVFGSSGPNRGKPEPFPAPKQLIHKKQSVHPHSQGVFGADEYGSYVAHRMYSQQPSQQQQLQHAQQQQHSLAVYQQQLLGMPQHAMPPVPAASGLHFGIPLQYIPSYQQNDPQLASPFLYGVAGMPSNGLDYTL